MNWISVEDRLPDVKKRYLILYDAMDGPRCEVVILETHRRKRFMSNTNSFEDFDGNITHWMPLPEPPTK